MTHHLCLLQVDDVDTMPGDGLDEAVLRMS